jgi:hypothetical protein
MTPIEELQPIPFEVALKYLIYWARQAYNPSFGTYGYDIYIPDNTDERVETTIYDAMREALVTARVRAHNMDRAQVELDAEGQIVVDIAKLYKWPKGERNEFDDKGAYIPL